MQPLALVVALVVAAAPRDHSAKARLPGFGRPFCGFNFLNMSNVTSERTANGWQREIEAKIWRGIVISLLGLAALFKVFALIYPVNLIYQRDPIFRVPILYVIGGASLIELFLVIYIWYCDDNRKTILAVLAFSVAILTYRMLSLISGISYCMCLGNVADWWPWLGRHEGPVLTSVSIWLLLTSAMQLLHKWK